MTLDLLGGGLFELGVAKLEDLDVLVGGKSLVKLVDLLLDSLLHLLLCSTLLELGSIGVNECGEKHLALALLLSADNRALRDKLDAREIFLDLLGEYVLSTLKNDNRLETTGDEAVFVLVKISDVAGSEPAAEY